MTTNNHTPGPWHITETHHHQTFIYGPSDEPVLADVNRRVPTSAADAALIAAAPELLEALKEIRLLTSRTIHPSDTRQGWEPVAVERLATIERKARAAIAKALGEVKV